jgi:hypothetical protein
MSITFTYKDCPLVYSVCTDYDDKPMVDETGVPIYLKDYEKSLNMTNCNAAYVFSELQFELSDDGCGEIEYIKLPNFIRACLRKLNDSRTMERTETESGSGTGLNIVQCGLSDESVRQRIKTLLEIAKLAQENKTSLIYF